MARGEIRGKLLLDDPGAALREVAHGAVVGPVRARRPVSQGCPADPLLRADAHELGGVRGNRGLEPAQLRDELVEVGAERVGAARGLRLHRRGCRR